MGRRLSPAGCHTCFSRQPTSHAQNARNTQHGKFHAATAQGHYQQRPPQATLDEGNVSCPRMPCRRQPQSKEAQPATASQAQHNVYHTQCQCFIYQHNGKAHTQPATHNVSQSQWLSGTTHMSQSHCRQPATRGHVCAAKPCQPPCHGHLPIMPSPRSMPARTKKIPHTVTMLPIMPAAWHTHKHPETDEIERGSEESSLRLRERVGGGVG